MAWSHILSRRLNLGNALRGSPRLGHYVFAFVFLVRLIALARLTSSPFLLPNGGDMHFYDDWARQILHGRFTDHFAFYGLPLYAYVLAFLYKVFGYGPFVPGFLQACLDAGTATLLYKIAIRIFRTAHEPEPVDNRACTIGILAAAGWAFFVPAQAYSVILMPTAWGVFVFWFLVWQIVKTDHAPSPLRYLAYGTLIGVTATGIATILFLVPLLLAALLLKSRSETSIRSSWVARGAAVALLFLGLGAGTTPCWIHNYFVARDPVFLSAHGGINFWMGNNPAAKGYPNFPAGMRAEQASMLQDSTSLAEAATGHRLQRSQVSAYWSAKAKSYIAANPGAWVHLLWQKTINFWNAFEYDDLGVILKLRESGVILPGLHFGVVAALAIPGIVLALRAFPASGWILGGILAQMVSVLPVFVTERYRLAAVPGLLIFASLGLWRLGQSCLIGRVSTLALYFIVLIASTAFVSIPQTDPALWALAAYTSGRQALESSDFARANQELERARAYVPDSPEINFALGNLRLAQRKRAEARSFYDTTLRFNPKHKGALNNLGLLALEEDQPATAERYLRRAIEQDPQDARTCYLLAKAELAMGNIKNARIAIERALEHERDRAEYRQLQEEIERRAHE
jgi:hypothetical protein